MVRYCLLRADPLTHGFVTSEYMAGARFHKTCVIVRLRRVRCAYIYSLLGLSSDMLAALINGPITKI
jgi:hypothetical protein